MAKLKNAKILIVEDEKIVAMDIKHKLESFGYMVPAPVSSGKQAIAKLEAIKPDLVLMDVKLGTGIDGIEAAEIIRNRFDIPVIYLTAYADEDTLNRAKATAPYGYILKPFQDRELHTSIEIAITKHKIEKEIRDETENALATIIGGAELILEEGLQKHDRETIDKIKLIRNAANVIKETIEKL